MLGRPSLPAPRFGSVRPCWLPQLRMVSQTGTATFGGGQSRGGNGIARPFSTSGSGLYCKAVLAALFARVTCDVWWVFGSGGRSGYARLSFTSRS
ncbi:hypothetical protein EJ02DRAFT_456706 [Clathrospora elynae]|uniref:Uncharacterized protein n=1 Tax=Clathrospora elynae TaxID=706981 RepID=A0A6A5SJ62_9PLEO|nr:hypothetical protein EJ02DRAFT_456706 [Clathrospora elynae]